MIDSNDLDNVQMEVGEDWTQGRTAFGGLLASSAVRSLGHRLSAERQLRSVLVTFVAPVKAGEVAIRLRLLRNGRSLTTGEARLVQDGEDRTVIIAAFGAPRTTNLGLPSPPPPEAKAPEDCLELPYLPGVTPAFTQHYEYRWEAGGFPFSSSDEPLIRGWIRPRTPERVDDAATLSLIDAWPPPLWPMASRPVPGSTVTWQVNYISELPHGGTPVERWWLFESRAHASAGGYFDAEGRLWSPGGDLVALSRQLFAEYSGLAVDD